MPEKDNYTLCFEIKLWKRRLENTEGINGERQQKVEQYPLFMKQMPRVQIQIIGQVICYKEIIYVSHHFQINRILVLRSEVI